MKKGVVIHFVGETVSQQIRDLRQRFLRDGFRQDLFSAWKQIFISAAAANFMEPWSESHEVRSVCEQIQKKLGSNLSPSFLFVLVYSGEQGSFSAHGRYSSYIVIPSACFGERESLFRNIFHEILHGAIHRCVSWSSIEKRLVSLNAHLPHQAGYPREQLGEEYLVQIIAGWEFPEIDFRMRHLSRGTNDVDEDCILGSLENLESAVCA